MSWPSRGSDGLVIRVAGGNTVGAVKTATFPPNVEFSNLQWYRQLGAGSPVVWAPATLIIGADQITYTLTAADVPAPGAGPIRVFLMADGLSVTSDYSVQYPAT